MSMVIGSTKPELTFSRLQELTKLDELTKLGASGNAARESPLWKECCAMFRCDPNATGSKWNHIISFFSWLQRKISFIVDFPLTYL